MSTQTTASPFTTLGTPITTLQFSDAGDFVAKLKKAGVQTSATVDEVLSRLFMKKSSRVIQQLVFAKLADCNIENNASPNAIRYELKNFGVGECSALAVLTTLIEEPETFVHLPKLLLNMRATDALGLPCLICLVQDNGKWRLVTGPDGMDVTVPNDLHIVGSMMA